MTRTFNGCSALEKITIGSSVKSVGAYAFNNCVNLKSIVVPNSVESLGDCAFKNCSNLASVKLSNTLLTMGYSIFEGCSNLTGIVIPATVTDIGYSAFKNLKNLTSVTFEANSNLVNLGKNFQSVRNLSQHMAYTADCLRRVAQSGRGISVPCVRMLDVIAESGCRQRPLGVPGRNKTADDPL